VSLGSIKEEQKRYFRPAALKDAPAVPAGQLPGKSEPAVGARAATPPAPRPALAN